MSEVENAVIVNDLYKSFRLPHEQSSGIKQSVVNFLTRKKGYETQEVLKGLSFQIKKGEFFGIVGRNGSGKSTLLKLLAEIYTPDQGSVVINGSLTPFIELGVGFNPELTGKENVYLNGALLGFSRDEMDDMYDDIVDFAELARFMDQRLKNYSSGMQVRLAFSIAIRAKGDILLLDEVLAVGDEAFQKKCYDYFSELRRDGKTVILVTHDMSAVQRFCTSAMLIDKGEIIDIGNSQTVSSKYSEMFSDERASDQSTQNKKRLQKANESNGSVLFHEISILQEGKSKTLIEAKQDFSISVSVQSSQLIERATLGINLIDSRGNIILATSTKAKQEAVVVREGISTFIFKVQNIYTDGSYSLNVALVDEDKSGDIVLQTPDIARFDITGTKLSKHSLTHPNMDIVVEYETSK